MINNQKAATWAAFFVFELNVEESIRLGSQVAPTTQGLYLDSVL